ncbi:CHL4-domain-containing protein [Westerdykella ornata]|uniref:CHL4-domain-containing protein n=1 Tax=Westerdykella ornata TaxID=318751 RepID=A0A6A6JSW4_WESOR|nr:CHL4-domain-containing protein [Westerdykella ornata]KAF2279701.1 CHL4-domain-containing protein [Westerdykella ornata]
MANPAPPPTLPDLKNIPHAHRLPTTHRDVVRTFSKLSRQSLISLAQQWLAKKNRDFCRPYFAGDDPSIENDVDETYAPAHSYDELQETYKVLTARKGGRKEVMDRILEGDWRSGISMYQLATAEIQHLLDHPTILRWTAKRMTRVQNSRTAKDNIDEVTNESEHLPRFQAQTFLMNLARELTPVLKAHYLITRIKTLPLTILRVYIHDSPYSSEASLSTSNSSKPSTPDSARAVFFIWPHASPFLFVSIATHTGQVVGDEGRQLRDLVLQAIPAAFSRPNRRYQLVPTNFTTKSLSALLAYRGPGKTNAAGGGFSIFADHSFSQNALDFVATGRPVPTTSSDKPAEGNSNTASTPGAPKRGPGRPRRLLDASETAESSKRRKIAQGRFGSSAKADDGLGVERFDVRIDDPFPKVPRGTAQQEDEGEDAEEQGEDEDAWVPDIRISFQGPHVFAGIRELVEHGVIDGEKMPGWMTGEAGVTIGTVKNGRIRAKGAVPGV